MAVVHNDWNVTWSITVMHWNWPLAYLTAMFYIKSVLNYMLFICLFSYPYMRVMSRWVQWTEKYKSTTSSSFNAIRYIYILDQNCRSKYFQQELQLPWFNSCHFWKKLFVLKMQARLDHKMPTNYSPDSWGAAQPKVNNSLVNTWSEEQKT